ncbi:MAG: hypothetical protein ABI859_15305 [Pseudomonadota bacterium]
MAGKRQHYVPRFLQRGFLHNPPEEAERTWLHRRGAQARLVGIRDVGVSEYFYSKMRADGAATLDDLITAIEGSLDSELSLIKAKPAGEPIDPGAAARLTAHLMFRTAHVRSVLAQGAGQILAGAATLFTDPSAAREHLGLDNLGGNMAMDSAVDKALQTLPLEALAFPRLLARRIVSFLARENFDALHDELWPVVRQVVAEMTKDIPGWIRDAHNRVLETTKKVQWEEDLAALSWQTREVLGAVLPDCVVLAREAGHDFTPFLLSVRHNVDLVVLPFAHDRVLVGSRGLNAGISVEVLNAASAACSDNFFISRCASDGIGLSGLIGQRTAMMIETSVSDALSPFQPTSRAKADRNTLMARVIDTDVASSFSYSLTCIGVADTEMAAQLGEIVNVIVEELSRAMPLSTLDGITFAVDYPAAVAGVDRGDPGLGAAQSRPRDYGRPVAKQVAVVRNGARKTHIVVDFVIADGLLSDNRIDRSHAIHTIVAMLAGVAHTARYESQLEEDTAVPPDDVARLMHQGSSVVPSSYFCARESAFSDPSAGERYAALVRDSLDTAREAITSARLMYRNSADMDALLAVALPQISFVLTHVAEWLGHREGLPDQDEFPGSSLPLELKSYELHLWLELFGRDLRNLYNVEGQFTSTNIFALGRHVERLLWTVQICPWPKEDGTTYVSVPFGNDEALLETANSPPSLG